MDPFVAEVRIYPFNFPPKSWAQCNGQLLPLSQNTALFALLGTMYGGDGKSTFALPDLMDRAPMHPDDFQYPLGGTGGSETVTLLESEMPAHTHTLRGTGAPGNRTTPVGNAISRMLGATPYVPGSPALVAMAPQSLSPAGGDFPHNNMMPYLTLNFCIALQGTFPPRP